MTYAPHIQQEKLQHSVFSELSLCATILHQCSKFGASAGRSECLFSAAKSECVEAN